MFTGIVEETGRVQGVSQQFGSARIRVRARQASRTAHIGESIAINGVCLTLINQTGEDIVFDAVPETLSRSNLGDVRIGDLVNVERSLQIGDRLNGHFVQGHIDGTVRLVHIEKQGDAHVLTLEAPPNLMKYIAEKGSVTLDGISLTVSALSETGFSVWIIPHTWSVTHLQNVRIDDKLNLEVDMLARYMERLLLDGPNHA